MATHNLVKDRKFCTRLLRIIGENPEGVKSFVIRCDANALVEVEVVRYLRHPDVEDQFEDVKDMIEETEDNG